MIKISTLYVYIKKVYHYNKWSLKINLFTKVFLKRSVLIFGRTQPFTFRKSSQIWNLCSGNKYPLKVLLVVHIVYSLTRRSNSEDKNARKKYWWENLHQPPGACLSEKLITYSRSYLATVAIAFVHAWKFKPKKARKIV